MAKLNQLGLLFETNLEFRNQLYSFMLTLPDLKSYLGMTCLRELKLPTGGAGGFVDPWDRARTPYFGVPDFLNKMFGSSFRHLLDVESHKVRQVRAYLLQQYFIELLCYLRDSKDMKL